MAKPPTFREEKREILFQERERNTKRERPVRNVSLISYTENTYKTTQKEYADAVFIISRIGRLYFLFFFCSASFRLTT